QRAPERGPAAGPLLHPGASVVQLGEPSDEREPDPGAGARPRALAERLEDPLAIAGSDARSVVFDDEHRALIRPLQADPDARIAGRVLHRVAEQVLDDPFD